MIWDNIGNYAVIQEIENFNAEALESEIICRLQR
jgi:hypothetical protein